MNAFPTEIESEEVIDFGTLRTRLAEKRWWLIGSVLVFTAVFTAAAFEMTPIYRASVLMAPAGGDRNSMSGALGSVVGQLGGLASMAGIHVGGADMGTEEALAVLRSRDFTGRFITDEQLLPVLFAKQWDVASHKWKVPEDKQPTLSSAYKYFDRIRVVNQDKKTGLITLQIDWRDRVAAATWANELVERVNAEMRTRAIAQVDASVGYLERELATTTIVEIREAINRLIEAQIKQRMLANVTKEYAFRVVDKAIAADRNDTVKPNKPLLLAMGPLVGLAVGIVLALLGGLSSPARRR